MKYFINYSAQFPDTRASRARKYKWSRDLIAENKIDKGDIIWSIIVTEDENNSDFLQNYPFIRRFGKNKIVDFVKFAKDNGANAVALFPEISEENKDEHASIAFSRKNPIYGAIEEIKSKIDIGVIADVAFDPFTSHGHDGFLDKNYQIDNDRSINALAKYSVLLANSGADVISPSDMLDGRIKKIRDELEKNNHEYIMILSYANKYASNLYSPYRDAIGSKKALVGDKKTYQMDFRNKDEGDKIAIQQLSEGADFILVKPAIHYLDRINSLANIGAPVFAFHVSGEAAMLYLASQNKVANFDDLLIESTMAIKRSGAKGIISYFGPELAKIL